MADYHDSNNWPKQFLEQHLQYSIWKQKSLDFERKISHNVKDIQQWFERFYKEYGKHEIQPGDCWNMDESGFKIGVKKINGLLQEMLHNSLTLLAHPIVS